MQLPIKDDPAVRLYAYAGTVSNEPPASYKDKGVVDGLLVQPLDLAGNPDPAGQIVILALGMSNTGLAWDGLTDLVNSSPAIAKNSAVVLFNGAKGGADLPKWVAPDAPQFVRVAGDLAAAGYSEGQVQAVWLFNSVRPGENQIPTTEDWPRMVADGLADCIRAAQVRYPNLKQVFLSSREYGGWAKQNPAGRKREAFLSGLGVRHLVSCRIQEELTGQVADLTIGSLVNLPFFDWSVYPYAAGATPNNDGVSWPRDCFERDGVHPNALGVMRWGNLLYSWFSSNDYTAPYFRPGNG